MNKLIIALIIILSLSFCGYGQEINDHPKIYRTVTFNPDVKTGYLSIINALNLKEINRIEFDQPGRIIELSANKKRVFVVGLSFSDPTGITILNVEQGFRETVLFQNIEIGAIKLASDGLLWVSLPNEQQIIFIDSNSLQQIGNPINVGAAIRDIAFSADGKFAYVLSQNGKIIKYDAKLKTSIKSSGTIPVINSTLKRTMEIAVSPDGNAVCAASKDRVTILNSSTLLPVDSFTFDNKSLFGTAQIVFSKDGRNLYVSELDGLNCNVYNPETKKLTRIFRSRLGTIQNIKLSEDGRLLYINDFSGRTIIDTSDQSIVLSDIDFFNVLDSTRGLALSGNFSIGQAPTLTVTAPSSKQQVMTNQAVTIKWQTTVAAQSYSLASHKVELSTDGGTTFNTIPKAESLAGDIQEFVWQVPDIASTDKAQIRVSTVDLGARRASNTTANFSIIKPSGQMGDTQAPNVMFLSPIGSEQFNAGDNLQISWMSSDNVGVTSQDLSLSTDGGATFPITIANGLTGTTQSFSFPIPSSLETQQAKLRLVVKDGAGNMAQAVTLANFRIESVADTTAPVVTISQPTTNQKLIAGQPIQVNWQSSDNKALVSQALLLSLDGGATFATVANFGASDNSFLIRNIEELNITNSRGIVRITATDAKGNVGQASTTFTIAPAITNAIYQSKILTLNGIGFTSNSSSSPIQLFVNEKPVTSITPMSINNTTFTIKGSKKKLGIVKGSNTVKLVVDGVTSNSLMFSF